MKLNIKIKEIIKSAVLRRRVIFVAAGAIAGYAYYYYIGCSSGSCPITGNPFISTIYGAIAGLILSGGGCANGCSTRDR